MQSRPESPATFGDDTGEEGDLWKKVPETVMGESPTFPFNSSNRICPGVTEMRTLKMGERNRYVSMLKVNRLQSYLTFL